MPAKRKKEKIVGAYLCWLVGRRDGAFYADRRPNKLNAGRHSLGTRDRREAVEVLKHLDLVRAVELGLAPPNVLAAESSHTLSLADGRRLYEEHVQRPRITGGAKPSSAKRYRAVFDKFVRFAQNAGMTSWNQVSNQTLQQYAAYLEGKGLHGPLDIWS